MATITMRDLLEAGIHFGHQTRRWNPKMARFIFGERQGIYIIDLQKTLRQLQRAYSTVRDAAAKGGDVLFVGTKKQAREAVQQQAERCGMYYINNRWLGGTLTNWQTIQQSIRNLTRLEDLESSGRIEQFTKKERIVMRKQREKLEKNLRGIKNMGDVPRVLFVIDAHREDIAVREARRLGITSIAVVDTNSDPDSVDIPIPGNDDAIRAVNLFSQIIADAVIEGRAAYEKSRQEDDAKRKAALRDATKTDRMTRQQKKYADEDVETTRDQGVSPAPQTDEIPAEAAPTNGASGHEPREAAKTADHTHESFATEA